MCECGCVANDDKYTFPAPDGDFYLLSMSSGCRECGYPAGFSIERLKGDNYRLEEPYIDGPLKFNKWPDGPGIGFKTGLEFHEFIEKYKEYMIPSVKELTDEEDGFDESSAEVLLEEMYEDIYPKPKLA